MAAIAIRLELQQYRPLAGAYPFKRGFCRTAYSENVHSVHLNTRNTKAFAAPVKLVLGGGAIDRSAHGVLIILNHEDRSEEHTSELQSLMRISYAVFCLKKKTQIQTKQRTESNK